MFSKNCGEPKLTDVFGCVICNQQKTVPRYGPHWRQYVPEHKNGLLSCSAVPYILCGFRAGENASSVGGSGACWGLATNAQRDCSRHSAVSESSAALTMDSLARLSMLDTDEEWGVCVLFLLSYAILRRHIV